MIPFYLMFKIFNFEVINQAQWVFVLGLFIMVWTNDTFAYLTGRSFGKTRLIERISPKKSWEGAIGGFLFTIIDRKSTRLNSSHVRISYAVFCLKKKKA